MDINMPNMDGKECTRRIRQLEALHDQPPYCIIGLTANAFEQGAALDAGMNDCQLKPLSLAALKQMLGAAKQKRGGGLVETPPAGESTV